MPILVNHPACGYGLGEAISPGQAAIAFGTQAAAGIATGQGSIREQLLINAPNLAGTGVSVAALLGSKAAAAAIPVVGVAIAGATIAIALWKARKGPYQKVQTTQIVNEAEPILQDNLKAYMDARTVEAQAWALQNFDDVWAQVQALCSDPQMGEPGRRCISERQRGGRAPWCPTGSGCDWFVLYRDPIANDPDVKAGAPPSSDSPVDGLMNLLRGGSAPGGGQDGSGLLWPLLGAALIGGAILL